MHLVEVRFPAIGERLNVQATARGIGGKAQIGHLAAGKPDARASSQRARIGESFARQRDHTSRRPSRELAVHVFPGQHDAHPFRGVHSTASIPGCQSWICAFGGCMARRNL